MSILIVNVIFVIKCIISSQILYLQNLTNYYLYVIVLLAVIVPTIEPFIGLIGAFCFSILGLLIPVFVETVTYWDVGFGPGNWVALKNVIICIIGIMALIFGSRSALIQIANLYS